MNKMISIIGATLILWVGRPFLLPIVTAVFFWYLTHSIASYYKKLVRYDFIAKVLAIGSLAAVVYMFASEIHPMFAELYKKMPEITAGIERLLQDLSTWAGSEISFSELPSFQKVITSVGTSIAGVGAAFGMILIYMLFIFIEQSTFTQKLRLIFSEKKQFSKVHFILSSIDLHMRKYLFVKTGISLMTAVSSYIWFVILGVDFAGMWSFLIFVMNYVPTFGSIASTVLPMAYVFAITGEPHVPLLIAAGSAVINLIFGNILDPKLTGKSLNLSALAILINLVLWGMLWGPLGMFFSVPILAMVFIVSAQFDRTRWIAILLSADGGIPDKNED